MAFNKAVQFRGISNVIKAYRNKDVPAWGLFQGAQFLEKYEGNDIDEGATHLRDYLNALDQRSNDMNTYTLCVYESPQGGKVNSATRFDASFNFRLTDTIEDHMGAKMAGAYEQRIAGLEQKISELTQVEDDPTPRDQLLGALGKILEHPHIQAALATKLIGLVDGIGNTLGAMFKVPQAVPVRSIGSTDLSHENQKLQQAVGMLAQVDPELGTHLLKLANVATNDPEKYKQLIGMLNLL